MNLNGILGIPQKILEWKVLFEPLKHGFDLPAVFVDLGDFVRPQPVVVGQENVGPVLAGVIIGNASQDRICRPSLCNGNLFVFETSGSTESAISYSPADCQAALSFWRVTKNTVPLLHR